MDELDARLHRIGQHHFRAKFRLHGRDRAVVDLRGIATVRRHAEELVERSLAPADQPEPPERRVQSFAAPAQHRRQPAIDEPLTIDREPGQRLLGQRRMGRKVIGDARGREADGLV